MTVCWRAALAVLSLSATLHAAALADDAVRIATDWRAEAEQGGIYQAQAAGIYKRYHLDVTIVEGGPNLNQAQLLAAGRVDFSVQSSSFEPLNFVREGVPVVAIAAAFQKDPEVLIAHPGVGNDTLEAMRGKPILIGTASRQNFWQFLKLRYGFTDDQIRAYNFNLAPFLANKNAIQQGYLTSEPYAIELATGEKPVTILLADQGFESYAALLATTQQMIEAKADVVQRFVDATMEGWRDYLAGDPKAANALILKDNPEMKEAILLHARDAMKHSGMVTSGDAATIGIGAMTDARWRSFFNFATAAGLYPKDLPLAKAYSLRFIGHIKPASE